METKFFDPFSCVCGIAIGMVLCVLLRLVPNTPIYGNHKPCRSCECNP